MASEPVTARAIVTYPPEDGKAVWKMEDVTLGSIGPNDVLVRIVASGICHTDLGFSLLPDISGTYPRVLGHEGAFENYPAVENTLFHLANFNV